MAEKTAEKFVFYMHRMSKIYPPGKEVLKDISLSFYYGAKIGIIGTNGSGKSTLLRIMAGIDKEFQGEAWIEPGRTAGYLPQEPQLDPNLTVKENVKLALELEGEDKQMFLDDLGIAESGLDRLIAASYKLLGLISYLTAGPTETRAWTIRKGTKAPGAAGKIHSDFERGFIKAEVVYFQDLLDCGTYAAAKEKGLVGIEGKEYVVQDGDIMHFLFNV